jgi:hypothetical protein
MKMIIQIVRNFRILPFLSIPLSCLLLGFGTLGVSDIFAAESVIVYSGRAERLIKPVFNNF